MVSLVQGLGVMKNGLLFALKKHKLEVEKPQMKQINSYEINGLLKPFLHSEAFK